MFRETIAHADDSSENAASEQHAMLLLRRAVNRGYAVDVTPAGGASITWTYRQLNGEHITEHPRSIRLAPDPPLARPLSETAVQDLELIDEARRAEYDRQAQVIVGGLWKIPPGATARLRTRGLVAIEDDGRARLTLTARIILFARQHRTRTTAPDGWYRPAGQVSAGLNKPGRRAGLLHSSASVAVCSCGFARHCGDRDEARRHVAAHRREVAGEFFRSLTAAPARS